MKLTGKLKETVAKAENKEQAREAIKKAGMILDDDELEMVSGGGPNLLEDLFDHGFQKGDTVIYKGPTRKFYGKTGTILKIEVESIRSGREFSRYFVEIDKNTVKCTASELGKA